MRSRSKLPFQVLLVWTLFGTMWILAGIVGCKKSRAPTLSSSSPSISSSSSSSSSQSSAGASLGVIRVGEVGSMTGTNATFGISTHRGILLAFDEVNAEGGVAGRKFELISLDDQGKASEAALAVTRLINQQGVQAILGEVASSISMAMAPIVEQFQIPMISPSSINVKLTQKRKFVFRVCFVDEFQSQVMSDFAFKNLKARRVALFEDTNSDYSRDSARIFSERFKKSGGEIVIHQNYTSGDIDFKAQLTAIRAKNPDLIVIPGYYTEIGLIARQKVELGMRTPLLGGDGWDSPKLKEIGGAALEGSYFVSHFWHQGAEAKVSSFVKKYQSTYGGEMPDAMAALGYDAASLLIDAWKRSIAAALPITLPMTLKDAIAATRDFQGITGKITIDEQHNVIKRAAVFQLMGDGAHQFFTWMDPIK